MPPGTRSKAVPRLALEQAESFLQDLPKREKETLSVSEAISGMSDTVRAALAKGYSYNEISDMLSDKLGISVSAWSLRRYIPAGSRRGKRGASAEAAPKRGRKKKDTTDLNGTAAQAIAAPTAIVEKTPAPIVETPAASAPAPTRRRTTTAKGKTATAKANAAPEAKPEAEAKPAAKTRTTRSKTAAATKPTATKAKASAKPAQSRRKKS